MSKRASALRLGLLELAVVEASPSCTSFPTLDWLLSFVELMVQAAEPDPSES